MCGHPLIARRPGGFAVIADKRSNRMALFGEASNPHEWLCLRPVQVDPPSINAA
jgi:hypothetical protein